LLQAVENSAIAMTTATALYLALHDIAYPRGPSAGYDDEPI
jgi:hypothetical protein